MTDQPTAETTPPATRDELDPATIVNGGTHVHVKHRGTDAEWDSPIDYYLQVGRLIGWEPYVAPAPSYAEYFDAGVLPGPGEPGGVPEKTGFDPGEHTVAAVNDYLASLLGDAPGEVARVLEAETAGQARKGILNGPHGTPEDDKNDDSHQS